MDASRASERASMKWPTWLPERTEPARILVVEDEQLLADELNDRLLGFGFEVAGTAATADAAVALAQASRPQLVLMDIRLKGPRDGIEAAAEILAILDVPIVFVTAHADDLTLRRALEVSPYGYLVKPIHERDLRVAVAVAIHKHALERRVRESEERYRTTLTSIGDGVVATDTHGGITFMNPVAERLTGWRMDEVLGRPVEEVVRLFDSSRNRLESPLAQALREGHIVSLPGETVLAARDGSEIPIDDCAGPVRRPDGEAYGAVLVFRDISKQLAAARALEQSANDLRQSQKMEAIGRLAGGVAHDFNNMMTIVAGYTELMLRDPSISKPNREMLEQVAAAAERSADITRQLLAFSRRQLLKPAVIHLNGVVESMELMLKRLVGEDVTIWTDLEPELTHVRADPGQMEQVLLNLTANARDAMPQGGLLSIETRNVDLDPNDATAGPELKPGRYVRLAVADTGVGMDADTRLRIFEPFFTTKELGRGTGLGLATVYGIVKQSGGQVVVRSKVGRGTIFEIFLPRVTIDATAPAAQDHVALPGGSETILVVEDDDSVRRLVQRLLASRGYAVRSAESGAAALRLVEASDASIDLLLTDVVMPGMNGRELAERLLARQPSLRVVYMSGYTPDEVLRKGIENETMSFLPKPFNAHQLLDAVRAALDGPRGEAGAPPVR